MTRISWRFWRADNLTTVALVVGIGTAVAVSTIACDPGAVVTYVNDTDRTVILFVGDDPEDIITTLEPHSSEELTELTDLWEDVVVVRDVQGNVLLREEITWDELKARDFRFVIRPEDLAPTPVVGP